MFPQPSKPLETLLESAKLIAEKEEDPLVRTIALFQSEIDHLNTVEQAIVNSMIAECLWAYLQQNQFEIFSRTPLANPDLTDVRTWDVRLLLQQCIAYYQASLEPREALQTLRVRDYRAMLTLGDDESEVQRPTMFDLLAFRAINAWSNEGLRLTQPTDGFLVDDPHYFSRANVFRTLDIPGIDTLSLDYQILKTYQQLCQFHAAQNNPNILIPLDLHRMAWVQKKAMFEDADSLYRVALADYLLVYPNSDATAQIYWALAEFHNELGGRHNSLVSDDFRWDKVTALRYTTILSERYAHTPFANPARALAEQIQLPRISLQMQDILLPAQHNLFLMRCSNADTVYFSLYRLSDAELSGIDFLQNRHDFFTRIASGSTFFRQWHTAIVDPGDHQTHRMELSLSPLPVGYYVLFASTRQTISARGIDLEAHVFGVSELAYVSNNASNERLEGIVLDRRTGRPRSGVSVRLFTRTFDHQTRQVNTTELATLNTGRDGRFQHPKPSERPESVLVELRHRSDVLLSQNNPYFLFNNPARLQPERAQSRLFLFTDRAVYRPGQTLHFKGILIEQRGDESQLRTNVSTTIKLFDANYREVSSVDVSTNEYGSFSGHFVLPSRGLNGQYYLQNEFGMHFFSVEEYKRPSFEIVFDPLKTAYQLDRELSVTGVAQTYSGAGLGHSTVKYRVVRSAHFPTWRRVMHLRPPTEETVITQGEAVSDENGRFEVPFIAFADKRIPAGQNPIYTYTVTVDVTDVSGETRQGTQRVQVSAKALRVALNTKPFMDKTRDSVLVISSTNLSGEKMPSQGTIRVLRLIPDQRLLRERQWEAPNLFELSKAEFVKRFPHDPYSDENTPENRDKEFGFEKRFDTETDSVIILEGLSTWLSGEYYYLIETEDMFGNPVTGVNFFTIYSPKTEREAIEQFHYTIMPNNTFEPGQTASWIIGSASRVTVFYEIRSKDGVLQQRTLSLNNEQVRIDFPIREAHRGNLSLQIWSVKDNRMYNSSEVIFVPFTNRNINISFETFRDRLLPNAQENWTLRLMSHDKKPLQGELLLSMYDASLDVFRKSYWNMDLLSYFHASSLWQSRNFQVRSSQQVKFPDFFAASEPGVRYDRLNFDPPFFSHRFMPMRKSLGGGMLYAARAVANDEARMEVAEDAGDRAMPTAMSENMVTTMDAAGAPDVPQVLDVLSPRTNLNETAFFYPFLRSDDDGRISVSFTVPESLTRWRIQGLAHTQDLKVGLSEWSALTQKTLMVYPNTPRFLREGDQINFQAKIVNLSDERITGQAQLIIDEDTPLALNPFTLSPRGNTSSGWLHRATAAGLLNLKFLAEAGTHTDGEVQMIPVLSNRALLTETLPMFATPQSTRTFNLARLARPNSTTFENHRLTLEVATNPIWFAVQALPELSSPNNENSIALFGSYFANAMAMDILHRNPEIKDVFNRWKTAHPEVLQSNLERNQELKSVLLDETPWVLEAASETRQKQGIALFFEENNVRHLQADMLTRLQRLQLANGGFAWHPGGRADVWSTQYIVHGMQKLHRRDIERENFELQNMLQSALNYCDEQHVEHHRNIVKMRGVPFLQANDIHYLYLRTYFKEHPVSPEMTRVLEVYDSLSRATWRTQSRYLQGILALYFDLKGDQSMVQDLMQNFQRLALRSPEMGMYWRYEPSWYWHESGIETQSQLIETFSILGQPDDVAAMKQWLLSQKRTTRWNTPKASVDAVYALLLNTPNLEQNMAVEIRVGDETISTTTDAVAGSGYFTRFWTADQINPKQAQVSIRNQGNAMVWGGLYWQYFENMDKVAPAATPLSVEKTLFVERMTNRGPELEPIPAEGLKLGDRVVVRIAIRADRDMDYVHLKDLRAAAFEPMEVRSGYRYQDGLFYYQDVKDVSMNFYFSRLTRGTYVFEYRVNVSQIGDFSNGYTTIQCLYAPEFSAQSQGERVVVN